MIYTSYFGNLKKIPKEYVAISISRYTPTWFKEGHKLTFLAPSSKLYKKGDVNDTEYIAEYRGYLEKVGIDFIMSRINEFDDDNIVLLCYEKSGFCHRHVLGDFLNDHGISCVEYGT
jgi:hypothetical protein